MQPFLLRASSSLGRTDVRDWAVNLLGRDLGYARYQLSAQTKSEVVFSRTWRSAGVWILTILLFPLGLIFFFAFKQTSTVTVLMEKTGGGTRITVSGAAKPRVVEGIDHRLSADFAAAEDGV